MRPSCSFRTARGSPVACFDKMYTSDYAIYNINRGLGKIV